MVWFLWICFAIFLWYPLYLFRNILWLNHKPAWTRNTAFPDITVVIPARNAGHEITTLLDALTQQKYPAEHWSCIVVDDASTDNTREVVSRYTGKIPRLKILEAPPCAGPAFKKNAIKEGIRLAEGTWILTTDADCRVGPYWISAMAERMAEENALVSGPVQLEDGGTLFGKFQQLEFAGLIGIGAANIRAGTPNMCNGANLAYRKSAFYSVGGFQGLDRLASGDDELLMHRIFIRNIGKLEFAMDPRSLVHTPACPDLTTFARQRIRWVSKGRHYERKSVTYILMLSYLALLALGLVSIFAAIIPDSWPVIAMMWGLKSACETLVILPVLRLDGKVHNLFCIIVEQPFHLIYVLWAGIAGTCSSQYSWRGRIVK